MAESTAHDLEAFANAAGQSNQPRGHALVRPTNALAATPPHVLGAQAVAVYRDEQRIMTKLRALAAAAGSDWFYRFPVRKAGGGTDYIEGASIKLANDVARIFGNNVNEIREIDVGDAWVFYARFTDLETGFSMERAYRQRKSQTSMRTKDADRQLDIAYQIGQSKAIRNCIVNSLQIYADYAFEQARNSLVEKIGTELPKWRERTLEGLARIPVDLHRVERVIGKAAKDWLAPDVAAIVSMMQSIADGMASVDEVFPLEPAVSSPTPEATGRGGGGGQVKAATDGTESSNDDGADARQPAAAADPLVIAHARGAAARKAGHSRNTVPEEYRDTKRIHEADAWNAGFDGKPAPGKML